MNPKEREQIIAIIACRLSYNIQALEQKTDEELERIYQERVEGR